MIIFHPHFRFDAINIYKSLEIQLFDHERRIRRVVCLPNETLISAGDDGQLKMWNMLTGRPFAKYQIAQGSIRDIAYNARQRSLAVGCQDGSLRIWRIEPWEFGESRVKLSRISRISFSPDGTYLTVGATNHQLLLYSTISHKVTRISTQNLPLIQFAIFHRKGPFGTL
jgi:WD40 repeat protein